MRHTRGIGATSIKRVLILLAYAVLAGASFLSVARPALGASPSSTEPVAAPAAAPAVPTGCWRLLVTPDAAATTAGRSEFEEYVNIETSAITAQEMSRLGFSPNAGSTSTNAAGQVTFTVTLSSNTQGTVTWTGTFVGTTAVSGTLKWVRPEGTYNYTYTGTPYVPPTNVES